MPAGRLRLMTLPSSSRCCNHSHSPRSVRSFPVSTIERKITMTQSTTHSCASCGSSVPEDMRFCPNCGTPAAIPQAPPPPPANSYAPTQRGAPFTAYPQQNNQPAYQPTPAQQGYQPPLQSVQPPPAYARPQKNS